MAKKGMKFDEGKPIAGALLEDFPRALKGVAEVSTFGANKYVRGSWKGVPDASQRYSDALMRHLLELNITPTDDESGLHHLKHIAWNALAILELHEKEK